MTLGFTQQINKKPNYFIQKIWEGLISNHLSPGAFEYIEFEQAYQKKFEKSWDITATEPVIPKVHTIREDPSNRWRAGMGIHMVINNRTKKRFQFAPVVKCVSVQTIEITEKIMTAYDCVKLKNGRVFTVQVDGKYLPMYRIQELAINDGFDSVEAFFAYFNTDFKGKIISWTD